MSGHEVISIELCIKFPTFSGKFNGNGGCTPSCTGRGVGTVAVLAIQLSHPLLSGVVTCARFFPCLLLLLFDDCVAWSSAIIVSCTFLRRSKRIESKRIESKRIERRRSNQCVGIRRMGRGDILLQGE